MSGEGISYRLILAASTESKARVLGIRRKVYLRGELFTITFEIQNPMDIDFPGGRFRAAIVFPTKQVEYVRNVAIPKLAPGKNWQSESFSFNALAEGYALVYPRDLDVVDGRNSTIGHWVDAEGREIEWDIEATAIHGFHVETRRDYYTYYALLVSTASLAILVFERLFSLQLPHGPIPDPFQVFCAALLAAVGLILILTR